MKKNIRLHKFDLPSHETIEGLQFITIALDRASENLTAEANIHLLRFQERNIGVKIEGTKIGKRHGDICLGIWYTTPQSP